MKLFSAPPRPTGAQRPASDTAQQRPTQQRPAQQRPAQQRPVQQRPAQQRPAQQHPAQQRPAQQRPAQQRPAQRSASQWTDDAARPRRSAPDDRRRVQQPAPAPAGKHGRKAKKAKKPKKKKSLGHRLLILFLVLAILAGLYLTAVYSDIPFIAKSVSYTHLTLPTIA